MIAEGICECDRLRVVSRSEMQFLETGVGDKFRRATREQNINTPRRI